MKHSALGLQTLAACCWESATHHHGAANRVHKSSFLECTQTICQVFLLEINIRTKGAKRTFFCGGPRCFWNCGTHFLPTIEPERHAEAGVAAHLGRRSLLRWNSVRCRPYESSIPGGVYEQKRRRSNETNFLCASSTPLERSPVKLYQNKKTNYEDTHFAPLWLQNRTRVLGAPSLCCVLERLSFAVFKDTCEVGQKFFPLKQDCDKVEF